MTAIRHASEVRQYLLGDYEVTDDQITEAFARPENAKDIAAAISVGSFAYYPGDKIAGREGWTEKDQPASRKEDDDDDE